MEETIKIQEEFENLIEQLQRLKSINELTSANAISTEKVIGEIDKFVLSVDVLKNKYDDDLTNKSQSIGKVISNLKESIQSIEEERKLISKNIDGLFNTYIDKTENSLGIVADDLKYKIDSLLTKIDGIDKNFSEIQDKHYELLIQRFGEHESSLSSSFFQKCDALQNYLLELENTLSEKAEGRKIDLVKSISKHFESLSNKVDENERVLLQRIGSQSRELKLIKVIQIVTGITILIGLLFVIIK